ncbi:hypothetical protein [Petroclostridium sp. X23]|uniref:hypothetical protein n=1 Tax=Petroclostridium sp. X23 TaxID=3045146 RepID=UPI0024ACA2AE|nr:hypothetical protein [Petroclostridium sp. X23]WHH58840.1 hypothetical protein QKW49_24115 [Petroclostridium sp. X23]
MMLNNDADQKSKAGRKPVYPYEFMLRELETYVAQNNGEEITIAGLAKNTKINKKHIWRDNKAIRQVIDKINGQQMGMLADTVAYEISPGPFRGYTIIVEQYFNNKKILIKKALEQDNLVNSYRQDALEGYKFKKENDRLKDQNAKLERELEVAVTEIGFLKKKIEYYENEIKKMAIQSTDPSIKSNKSNKNNIKMKKAALKLEECDLEITNIKQLFNELKIKYNK